LIGFRQWISELEEILVTIQRINASFESSSGVGNLLRIRPYAHRHTAGRQRFDVGEIANHIGDQISAHARGGIKGNALPCIISTDEHRRSGVRHVAQDRLVISFGRDRNAEIRLERRFVEAREGETGIGTFKLSTGNDLGGTGTGFVIADVKS
jgi:hypothetical protein